MVKQSQEELLQQIKDLKNRLDESEQLIEAIKAGEVDAFAINNESGAEVYALQSGDYAYRVLIEELEESALNVTEEGLIVYTNPHFCNFLQLPYEKVIGTNIKDFVYTNSKAEFSKLLSQSVTGKSNGEINLTVNNKIVQVYISFTSLLPKLSTTGILITDLTEKIRTKQIEESEKQLSRMANAMPQLVWIADANGKVIYYNERVSEYAGANKTENEKWLWNELIYAEDFKATKEAWTEAISNEVIYEIQHRIQMKDGTYRWHLSRGMPQRNELGKIISWYGTATDIDQQKIAEEQIRESEERFRFALKAGHLGSWELDLETLDMKSSEGCKANFGQPVNLPFSYQTLRDSIHDDDKDRMLSVVAQTIDTGEDYDIEYRVVWPDKSLHWVNIRGQLRRSEKGEPVSMVGVSLDITERKKAEEILSESEERFRTLAETLPSLVWMTDEKGKQLYISERWEQYAGVKPDETNWTQILHPDDIEHTGKEWVHSLQTGKSYHTEVRLKNKDNQYNWYYGVGEPLCNNDNKIIRWIGAFTDIHEQKIFAEKLEHEVENRTNELLKKNKELESFSYIASHDLQEPLRKIQTFINLLHKHKEDANALEKYLVKIQDAAQRMSKLIQNVLEYSRISKSGDALVPTDLNIVLKNVKSDYELLIEERNATIISETLPVINAIPLQIHQLFANLISNAIKFSDKQPEIKITCEIVFRKHIPRDLINTNSLQNFDPNEKITILKFSDNGVGFDQQYSEKIFQLFQRLHAKAEYPGTGIGLSIVKKIVEEHNGFITATSAEGKGTTFTIWLPGFIQDA